MSFRVPRRRTRWIAVGIVSAGVVIAAVICGSGTLQYGIPAVVIACALAGHRPLWSAVAAVIAGAIAAYIMLKVDEASGRFALGILTVIVAIAYARPTLARLRAALSGPGRLLLAIALLPIRLVRHTVKDVRALPNSWPDRAGEFAGLVASSALAVAGGLVGSALVVGRLIAGRDEPIPSDWLYVGLGGLALLVFAIVHWWTRSCIGIVCDKTAGHRLAAVLALASVVLVGFGLDQRKLPNERQPSSRAQIRESVLARFDVLLVVDPGAAAGRRLVNAAASALRDDRLERLEPAPPTSGLDVAVGVAVLTPQQGTRSLWRLVEAPTTDHLRVLVALAGLQTSQAPAGTRSYGRLVHDIQRDVRWRDSTLRGAVLMLDRLPSIADLDGGTDGAVIPRAATPRVACSRLYAAGLRDVPRERSTPVRWRDALHRLCADRHDHEVWEKGGRPARFSEVRPVALYAVTGEHRQHRLAAWRSWTAMLDGRVLRQNVDPRHMLTIAQDLHTGTPVGELAALVHTFRPHLRFDDAENYPPTDVDWLLFPSRRQPPGATADGGSPEPQDVVTIECSLDADGAPEKCARTGGDRSTPAQACDRGTFTDNCEPVYEPADLAGALDEHIDLDGRRPGPADFARTGEPSRMYVHVRERSDELRLGYWWFFRYNTSPWRKEVNCLPGLTFKAVTCHDHEGDWEGVTVVLRRLHDPRALDPDVLGNIAPEAVIYEAHGRPIRWEWPDVQLAADEDSYATHPVVYVAAGSHASYPIGCAREECDQALSGPTLGDGGFDGGEEWSYNDQRECDAGDPSGRTVGPCLIALPATGDGRRGVLWNAFPGAWGQATCTVVAQVCSTVDGPASPAAQQRFGSPFADKRHGSRQRLSAFVEAYRGSHPKRAAAAQLRWPPQPWPRSKSRPLLRDARLPR